MTVCRESYQGQWWQEDVNMFAGDFNGACWLRKAGPDQQFGISMKEAFKNTTLPCFKGPDDAMSRHLFRPWQKVSGSFGSPRVARHVSQKPEKCFLNVVFGSSLQGLEVGDVEQSLAD